MQHPDLNFTPTPPSFTQPHGGYRSTLTGRFLSRVYVDSQLALWWTQELQRAWTRQVTLAALVFQGTAQDALRRQQLSQERHIVVDSDSPIRRKPTKREQEDKRRQALWNQPRNFS